MIRLTALCMMAFSSLAVCQQCEQPLITQIQQGLKTRYTVCDSVYRLRDAKARLIEFDDSRRAYRNYQRAKWIGLGVSLGFFSALLPVSLKAAAQGSPYGNFIILPVMIPAFISASIQKKHLTDAIARHNDHYQ